MYIKKNNQDKIKTIFYTKDQIIKEYWFKITSTIKDIFNYFENHIKDEGYSLKSNYKIFQKRDYEDYTISFLMKKEINDIILDGEIWLEVEEEIFFDDDNDETFYTLLHPKINPFGFVEYNSLKSRIKIIECPEDTYNYYKLNKFTKESAFCNSINSLYMSGGEVSGRAINNFWIINKHNYKINKMAMPIFKKYHSMLYIPDNFILIAGGDSLNSTIYDIENQEFINWAYMNKKHFQPGLLIFGDYVYAFSALNDVNENNNYFEKTNLTSKNPKWNIIYLNNKLNNIKMNCHFFGISKFSYGNILFVGGEKNNPNYIYNPLDNEILISNGKNSSVPFWDKSFYKISKKYNACIPLNFNNNYKMAFLDKEKESLIEVKCDQNTGFVPFNLNGNNNNDNSGNIFIKSTIKNIKTNQNINIQIGSNPKELFKKNLYTNHKTNEGFKFNDEKIIVDNIYDGTKIEEKNKNTNNRNYHKKSYLYIPDTFVAEQIIDRQIDLVNNSYNDKINIEKHFSNENDDMNRDFNEEDLSKKEFIVFDDLKSIKDNNKYIPSYRNRGLNKKAFLYIPNNAIEDQIINRELIPSENYNSSINYNNQNKKILANNKINKDEEFPSNEINHVIEDNVIITYENSYNPNHDFKRKHDKGKQILYIPYSSIDDNIIYRKVDFNDNKIKDESNSKKKENSKPYMKKTIDSNKSTISRNDERKNSDILEEGKNEIINYFGGGNEIIKTKKNQYKNKVKIYLPEYAIEDSNINREIISDKKSF